MATSHLSDLAAPTLALGNERVPRSPVLTVSRAVAVSLAVVALVSAVACLFFIDYFGPLILLPFSLGTFAAVGVMLAFRRPMNPIAWLFLLAGASWSLWFALQAYAWYATVDPPGLLPGGGLAAWSAQFILVPAGFTVMAVVLFPTGRPPSRAWAPLLSMVVGVLVMTVAVTALAPEPIVLLPPWSVGGDEGSLRTTPNPVGVGGALGEWLSALEPLLGAITGMPLVLLLFIAPAFRFARSSEVERVQLKWFAYAASFSVAFLLVGFALPTSSIGMVAWAAGVAALGLIPVAAAIAILRYRLFDIDLLISRSLSYVLVSALIVGLYLVTATVLGALLHQPEHALVSAAAALLVAVLLNPVRVRLQRRIDHLIYGERDEPYAVLRELGRRLGETLEPDAVLPTVARTVASALRLPYVAIELIDRDGEREPASSGRPRAGIVRLPLVYQQATIGHLLVAPRAGEQTLGRHDLAVLEALARQAGVAAHGIRITTELRRARARLVVAQEEERDRLLRDLHDELGPRLASHALLVDATRTALRRGGHRADALLEDLARELRQSLDEVRRIARGLRPPTLDEHGLPAALRAAATQCSSGGLRVDVDVPEVVPCAAAVETATYHVAREALANVVRHADARRCVVRLHFRGEDALVLEVEDDGRGLAPGTASGIGLRSMRERAAELGGQCLIEERPGGGTRVMAVFPAFAGL